MELYYRLEAEGMVQIATLINRIKFKMRVISMINNSSVKYQLHILEAILSHLSRLVKIMQL
jgi:hypothetical protein